MRKPLLSTLVALVAACVVALSGCGGPSVEDMIRTDLTEQLDEIKAGEEDFLDEVEASAGESFAQLGVDPAQFAQSYLDGFTYTIDEVTVEDTTATAKVTMTLKSMGDIISAFETTFADRVGELDLAALTDEQQLYTLGGEVLTEVTEAAEPREVTCEFTYTKDDDGEWSCDDSAETEMMNAMLG